MCGMKQTASQVSFLKVESVFACVDLQVMKSTGFFRGLYTSQELDAKSIQVRAYMMCVSTFHIRGACLMTTLQGFGWCIYLMSLHACWS